MANTAVETIREIMEENGWTPTEAKTIVPALEDLGAAIAGGGGSSPLAHIDLGITGASAGELAQVASVDPDGKPTSWTAVAMRHTLTVTCLTQDGVTVTDQTVTIRQGGPNGQVFASATYAGQPVSFALPEGFVWHASVSDTLAHHFNPTTATGVIVDADQSCTLTYSDFSSISTAPDIQAALDADLDLTDLVGESITCARGNGTLEWDVADYDATVGEVTLLMHDCSLYSSNVVFEPAQALMWCENGLSAGDYTFKWNATQKYLTLVNAIPAGGQLVANATSFSTYASVDATTAIETGTVSETATANPTDLGTTGQGLLNHHDRVSYGSNNYAESRLLQLLNSDAAANTPTTMVTKFQRPYSYSVAGLKYGLDPDFLACIADTVWQCSANNVYECPTELGGLTTKGQAYTVTAKFGLLSEMEVFGSYGGVADGSTILDLFNGATNDERKRYRGTSAQYWWLRSPSWISANNERNVHTSGAANSSGAYGSYAAVPACKIRKSN